MRAARLIFGATGWYAANTAILITVHGKIPTLGPLWSRRHRSMWGMPFVCKPTRRRSDSLINLIGQGRICNRSVAAQTFIAQDPTAQIPAIALPMRGVSPVRLSLMPMSVVGQKRRFAPLPATSGLPRLADLRRVIRHVAKVPKGEIARLTAKPRTGPGLCSQ